MYLQNRKDTRLDELRSEENKERISGLRFAEIGKVQVAKKILELAVPLYNVPLFICATAKAANKKFEKGFLAVVLLQV